MTSHDAAFVAAMHPRWVMLGAPAEDGVMIVASRELTLAEVRQKMSSTNFRVAKTRFTFEMEGFVIALGADYLDALTHLMGMWTPPNEENREIET